MGAHFTKAIVSATVACTMLSAPVMARKASHLSDLVGARGSSGEMALERQGFTYIDGHKGSKYSHTYWWHGRDKNCIEVKTANGRYAAIVDVPNSDCHQKSGSGNGAAVAAGAIVGVALLAALASHKSSHHDDGKHHGDPAHETQYERGFNDGLHHVSYHNYDKSDHYAKGYEAGVAQRNRNTDYHSGHGGYASRAFIADIQGMDSIRAFDMIRERGFDNVDDFSSGDTNYGIFYNRRTGQCVQTTNVDGEVYDIRDIGSHPRCT